LRDLPAEVAADRLRNGPLNDNAKELEKLEWMNFKLSELGEKHLKLPVEFIAAGGPAALKTHITGMKKEKDGSLIALTDIHYNEGYLAVRSNKGESLTFGESTSRVNMKILGQVIPPLVTWNEGADLNSMFQEFKEGVKCCGQHSENVIFYQGYVVETEKETMSVEIQPDSYQEIVERAVCKINH
jgi:hypothetical protein